jgi:eukaryotic-like serine/threonine-protein kinase
MDAERWRRARALFDELADTPPAQWEARLAELAPDDAEVRREALELLQADLAAAGSTDVGDRARAAVADLAARDEAAWSQRLVGERLGPYALVRELGRGGMGAVWLAERADGEFEQRVAVKLIRPGWDAGELLARFRAERQILAGLTHPNIAHLLDGGVTADGKPWLALEYVDGVDLLAHCDGERLDLAARLRLFLTVCDAVAHAHARLVVHRDLKPSNLLVTRDGQVKLLDFGIAKLVDPQGSDVSALRVFTPEYAAPEQVKGELVTTAVDVYALGLLLYALLTGRRPYRAEGSTPAAYERAILDQEPTRPSLAATREEPEADAAAEVAAQRRLTPELLRELLRGDLDAIVLKALRKEPAQRYAGVAELAADIVRHLERRPVLARRGGWRYRAQRFLRRHAAAAALAALALLALVGGLAAALWQGAEARSQRNEARMQRDLARAEAAKSAEVVAFMRELFEGSDPAAVQRNDVTARDLLERGVERVRARFASQPAVRAQLMAEMAKAYNGIGLPRESTPLLREVVETRRLLGEPLALAGALIDYAGVVRHGGREEALALLDEADRLLVAAGGSSAAPSRELRLLRARSRFGRGVVLIAVNDTAGAGAIELRAAAAEQRELLGATHEDTLDSQVMLARALGIQQRFDEALAAIGEVIATLRAVQPPPANDLAEALQARGRIEWRQKRYPEYLRTSQEVLMLAERAHGPGAFGVTISRHNLATALFYVGRYAEASAESARAIARARELLPPDHPFLLAALQRRGDCESAQEHWAAAAEAYAEALGRYRRAEAEKPGSASEEVETVAARLAAVQAHTVPAEVARVMTPSP